MSRELRILVTGVSGQVGGALVPRLKVQGFEPLAVPRNDMDLASPQSIFSCLERRAPDLVINCAAYTAVDKAESEPDLAFAINGEAPARMAEWCAIHAVPLVQVSTDYVFPGDGRRPYREDDPVAPRSVYGASKLAGEEAIRATAASHVILRTAWVYAANGKNFVRTMLRLGQERDSIGVVADQRGCPTSADSIADALCVIAGRLAAGGTGLPTGTYHFVDAGETTWHGFADRIFQLAERRWGRRPTVLPITTDQYPTPARRPAYSVLDTAKFRRTFDFAPPSWQDSLERVVDEIFSSSPQPSSPAGKDSGDARQPPRTA
jgi:dTDP-4-dehydrorhamnose reductase